MGLGFGTDGIRGVALKELTPNRAFACGNALAKWGKSLAVGKDTRLSGDCIKFALISGFLSGGGSVWDLGVTTTPCVSYITATRKLDFGVMISASHNPPIYNGIKVFDKNGYKLDDQLEKLLEYEMEHTTFCQPESCGKYVNAKNSVHSYLRFLAKGMDLRGLNICLDLANGSAYKIAPIVFRRAGAKVYTISNKNDGGNINVKCGATDITTLKSYMQTGKFDLGIAFDGDADRVIIVDSFGNVIDGDLILFALAKDMLKNGKLINKRVVGTPNTNYGVIKALEGLGIEYINGDVGDKYVLEQMLKCGAILGGEQSGHIILLNGHTTGDGIYAGLRFASLVKDKDFLKDLISLERFAQTTINVKVADKGRVIGNSKLTAVIDYERDKLGNGGKIFVRPSGTEQVIRVLVETKDKAFSDKIANRIKEVILQIEQ